MVVKLSGTRTYYLVKFESSVISYGSQTLLPSQTRDALFESSVISYGSQTSSITATAKRRLRVV